MEAEIKFEGIFTGTNFPFSISNLAFPLPTFYWPPGKLASSSRIRIIPLVSLYMDALAVTCCFYMKVLNPCQTASSHWIKKDKSFLLKFEIKTVGWCVCVCVCEKMEISSCQILDFPTNTHQRKSLLLNWLSCFLLLGFLPR